MEAVYSSNDIAPTRKTQKRGLGGGFRFCKTAAFTAAATIWVTSDRSGCLRLSRHDYPRSNSSAFCLPISHAIVTRWRKELTGATRFFLPSTFEVTRCLQGPRVSPARHLYSSATETPSNFGAERAENAASATTVGMMDEKEKERVADGGAERGAVTSIVGGGGERELESIKAGLASGGRYAEDSVGAFEGIRIEEILEAEEEHRRENRGQEREHFQGETCEGGGIVKTCKVCNGVSDKSKMKCAEVAQVDDEDEDPIMQYIAIREDLSRELRWPSGAVVAQACHASIAAVTTFGNDEDVRRYISPPTNLRRMRKVVVGVEGGEQALRELSHRLTKEGVDHFLWEEQPEGIPTALAAKPSKKSLVARHFRPYRLLRK